MVLGGGSNAEARVLTFALAHCFASYASATATTGDCGSPACSGHGACSKPPAVADATVATCACEPGFEGGRCELHCPASNGITCNGEGTCRLAASDTAVQQFAEGSSDPADELTTLTIAAGDSYCDCTDPYVCMCGSRRGGGAAIAHLGVPDAATTAPYTRGTVTCTQVCGAVVWHRVCGFGFGPLLWPRHLHSGGLCLRAVFRGGELWHRLRVWVRAGLQVPAWRGRATSVLRLRAGNRACDGAGREYIVPTAVRSR